MAGGHGVKRALHAYAEKSLRVREREIIVFSEVHEYGRGVGHDMDTQSRATRAEQDRDNGACLCPTFPLRRRKKSYQRRWNRSRSTSNSWCVSFALHTLKQMGFLSVLYYHRSGFKFAYFKYSNEDRVKEILNAHQWVPITVRG